MSYLPKSSATCEWIAYSDVWQDDVAVGGNALYLSADPKHHCPGEEWGSEQSAAT